MEGEDRRRFSRFNLLVDVEVSKRIASGKEQTLSTRNISQGGVCIIAYELYKIGDLLNIKLRLPDVNEDIDAIGKVAWIKEFAIGEGIENKKYDVGVEFIGINDSLYEKINKYLFIRQEKAK